MASRQGRNPLENYIRNVVRQTLAEFGNQENDLQEFDFGGSNEGTTRRSSRRRRRRSKGSVTNPKTDRRLKRNREAET
jgi:hypothetical protein